jgi:flagellar secretion chaperone FliS
MNGLDTYKEVTITTQSKGRLVVMLYEGAIKFLKQAILEFQNGNVEMRWNNIKRAMDIIDELNAVLNMEAGGEVAINLRKLYIFMNRHLSTANIKKSPQMVQEVVTLLEELNQGWKAIT